jgi:DNA-binding response OmpR family regulator
VPEATLLVVDDDPLVVKLLQMNLEMEGYTVITAADGEAGARRAREDRPDLIVCDVMMPRMDGMELTRAVKADPATAGIPIILLSAKAGAADIKAGRDAGADEYLTKPFDHVKLFERVAALLAAR